MAVAFLGAPPGDPVADAFVGGTADDADAIGEAGAIDKAGEVNGAAILAGTAGLDVTPSSLNGSRTLRVDGLPAAAGERPSDAAQSVASGAPLPEAVHVPAPRAWDASHVVTEIYSGHYNQLVRLACLLVHDVQTAEEVVQDAFEAMHDAWRRLRDREKALSYLRQAVVNRSRSVLRHRKVVDLHPPKPAPDEQSAEHAALTLLERTAVVSALHSLPVRQREAIVLRYYGGLSEADIATAMGISRGAVKSHTARAMAALKSFLEQKT